MTDNEIIKALECCNTEIDDYQCPHCPLLHKGCKKALIQLALDLITRQQAKIDDLMARTAVTTLIDDAVVYTPTLEDYNKFKKKFKSEAAKELAERIKEFMHNKFKALDEYEFEYITERDIDNLVKETVGDDNAEM